MDHVIFTCNVKSDWVDYNGHMNDAEYARVFSLAVEELMIKVGIDESFRNEHQYSIYTLETHICYLDEVHEGEMLQTTMQLLDHDDKRLHVFFTMHNKNGNELATSEQMLMGMDMKEGRPASFPEIIEQNIQTIATEQQGLSYPEKAGSQIGIRRK